MATETVNHRKQAVRHLDSVRAHLSSAADRETDETEREALNVPVKAAEVLRALVESRVHREVARD